MIKFMTDWTIPFTFWYVFKLQIIYMEPFNLTFIIATCYHGGPNIFFFTVTIRFCFMSLIHNNSLNLLNIVCLICNIIQVWTSCVKFSENFWKNTKIKTFSVISLQNSLSVEILSRCQSVVVHTKKLQ